jgi:hypothetical protein
MGHIFAVEVLEAGVLKRAVGADGRELRFPSRQEAEAYGRDTYGEKPWRTLRLYP